VPDIALPARLTIVSITAVRAHRAWCGARIPLRTARGCGIFLVSWVPGPFQNSFSSRRPGWCRFTNLTVAAWLRYGNSTTV